jgi:Protein of unknown function (DUF2934)
MQNLDEAIRERAYHLWIADGRPDGRADAFWLDAQREILTTTLRGAGQATLPDAEDAAPVAAKPVRKARAAGPRKSKSRAA